MAKKQRLGSDPLSWIGDSRPVEEPEDNTNNKENSTKEKPKKQRVKKAKKETTPSTLKEDKVVQEEELETKPEPQEEAKPELLEEAIPEPQEEKIETEAEKEEVLADNGVEISKDEMPQQTETEVDEQSQDKPEFLETPQNSIEKTVTEPVNTVKPNGAAQENETVVKKKSIDVSQNVQKYLAFSLSGEEYGIEISKVQEIIGVLAITRVPRTPEHISGVINLRGKIVPVLDMRILFGMEKKETTEETCIIVVHSDDVEMGIIVDRVSEVVNISASQIEEAPTFGSSLDSDFILGIGKAEGSVKILLDIDKVLVMQISNESNM